MAASMTAYTVNDAFLKLLGDDLPMFQVLFLRGIATVICLVLLGRASRSPSLLLRDLFPDSHSVLPRLFNHYIRSRPRHVLWRR